MQNQKKTASALNDLLTRNYDAEKGYTEGGTHVGDGQLRKWMFENAERRKRFGKNIKAMIRELGEAPDKGSSFLGDLHRTWMDIKSNTTKTVEEVVLEECLRGEEKAIEDYNQVLNEVDVPAHMQETLAQQRDEIAAAYEDVKQLEKSYDQTS